MKLRHLLALAVLLLALLPAAAAAQTPFTDPSVGPCAPLPDNQATPFGESTNRLGAIDLVFFNVTNVPVTYWECVNGKGTVIGHGSSTDSSTTTLRDAVPWSCVRLTRHFAATANLSNGQFVRGITSVRTPSCTNRFKLDAPATARAGSSLKLRTVDRWGIGGITVRLCVSPPRGGGARHCYPQRFTPGSAVKTKALRFDHRGDWKLDLQVRSHHVRQTVAVGVKAAPAKPLPVVLATGDSTMQGVESSLGDDLADIDNVRSDVHPGSTISSDDWVARATSQMRTFKPTDVVLSVGAAEGFPITSSVDGKSHDCCDASWKAEYVRRLKAMFDVYTRHGKGHLYALTIVANRDPRRQAFVAVVNDLTVQAAAGRKDVTVLRMDELFSPNGYVDTIQDNGRTVAIREPDGVHLNATGTAIEAREVAKVIRADQARGTRR